MPVTWLGFTALAFPIERMKLTGTPNPALIPADPNKSPSLDENAACEECGQFGAVELGGRKLCMDCYQKGGSCCPEFGKDDLWTFLD